MQTWVSTEALSAPFRDNTTRVVSFLHFENIWFLMLLARLIGHVEHQQTDSYFKMYHWKKTADAAWNAHVVQRSFVGNKIGNAQWN